MPARSVRAVLGAVFVAMLAGAPGGVARAADWPHLRGPTYDGVSSETGLAGAWPPDGPPVLWQIDLGQGFSGFAVVGERVYTQRQTLAGQFVVCLDARTGRRVWEHRYGWPWKADSDYPGPMATPTVVGGKVYFAGASGLVGCLDAGSGRRFWAVNVTETFKGRGTEYGYACSPLVEDGRVFLPVGGEGAAVVALDARSGAVLWRWGDERASYSPAYPITVQGRRQVVTLLQNVLVGLEPETGRLLWQHRWSEGYDEHAAWPVYAEPYLMACAAFRQGATVLRLGGVGDSPAAEVAWQSPELSNDVSSSVIVGGCVYGFDLQDLQPRGTRPSRGTFKCLDLATGRVRWATDRTGHTTVIAADGRLILLNEHGELILARASPGAYEELARTRVFQNGFCWTAPALAGGRLYVRDHAQAACLYLGDPRDAPPAQFPSALASLDPGGRQAPGLRAVWRGPALYAPTLRQMVRWYAVTMAAVVAPAAAAALALGAALRRRRPQRSTAARALLWTALLALGFAGTPLASLAAGEFIFTWPAAVFAAYQMAALAAAQATEGGRRTRWRSRLAAAALVAVCLAYGYLCRRLGVMMGYGFLFGLLPAFPAAALAAWRMKVRPGAWSDAAWTVGAFSAYFWASAAFTVWRTHG